MTGSRSVRQGAVAVCLAAVLVAPGQAEDAQELLNKMRDFNAVQVEYRQGVPHTDKRGRVLTTYDAEKSFCQLAVWGNPWGEIHGRTYDLKVLNDAGFNTMWPWPGHSLEDQLETGRAAGLQVVTMRAHTAEEATKFRDHPNWLGFETHVYRIQ